MGNKRKIISKMNYLNKIFVLSFPPLGEIPNGKGASDGNN
jgi:hypothetical protein